MGCATIVVKYLFFAFNFIFWVLGIAAMAVGIYSRVLNDKWHDLLQANYLVNGSNLLIAAGVIVMVLGFLGCCGAIKEYNPLLIGYSVLVVLIFILEIAGGGYAYSKKDDLEKKLTEEMTDGVTTMYDPSSDHKAIKGIVTAIDWFQRQVKCCGGAGSTDWPNSAWLRNHNATAVRVPMSCCKSEVAGCNTNENDGAKIYTVGCVEAGKKWAIDRLWLVGGVGIGIAVVQLVALFFSICLICSNKKDCEKTDTQMGG